jgi:hypothetical protein
MALTPEQLSQVELTNAIEEQRNQNNLIMETRRAKIEFIRMARETLIENARNKPVSDREVTAEEIINFAAALEKFIE